MKPVYEKSGGTAAAGNSSQLSDGASMSLIVGEAEAAQSEPLCRIVSRAVVGNDPDIFVVATDKVANIALERAGAK
jgi:acetyl-CoA acetyltransferase